MATKDDTTIRFDLLNIQFIRNLNAANYFNVYRSSYNRLNDLAAVYNTNINYLDTNGDLTFMARKVLLTMWLQAILL